MLIDSFGRKHNYLRISLTEKCNLRCIYCMPASGIDLSPKEHLMTAAEIEHIARVFVQLGITKIRLTGGEPLVRKDFSDIVARLGKLGVQLAMTTNGILIQEYLPVLLKHQVNSINVSLDTLNAEKFKQITLRNDYQRIRTNIDALLQHPEINVKLNVVLMKGTNDDEILDFVALTENTHITVQFIEFMPFQGNAWDHSKCVTKAELLQTCTNHYGKENVLKSTDQPNDTAQHYQINGFKSKFGIISTITNPFCDSCNRIRLTANGRIKNCLFSTQETDLLTPYRNGQSIELLIQQSIQHKKKALGGMDNFNAANTKEKANENRSMIMIGG